MTTETKTRIFTQQFTTETERGLRAFDAAIIKPKERTLYDFEKEGRKFTTFFLTPAQRNIILSVRSRPTEIAYLPKSLFFFGDLRHDTFQDQVKMIDRLKEELNNKGIKGVDVIFPSVADCMEIYEAELQSESPTNIFGKQCGYPLVRTSTELDPDSTVIIGLDDLDTLTLSEELALGEKEGIDNLYGIPDLGLRGIHIGTYPKDNNNYSGLYLMPIIIPRI